MVSEQAGEAVVGATASEALDALLGLYKVLLPAEGDFTDAEQAAMDDARRVLERAGVDLDALAS